MKRLLTSLALAASFIAIGTAAPSHADDSGWYLGGNYGGSEATFAEQSIRSNLLESGFSTTSFAADDSDSGYKVFLGYQFSRYFAIESGFFDLGSFDFLAETDPPGSVAGEIEVDGFNIDAVGLLPLGERFSFFGRIGANHAKSVASFQGTGSANIVMSDSSGRDTNIKFGLGAQWKMSDRFGLRLEAERYRIDDGYDNRADIDLLSIGLVARFGRAARDDEEKVAVPPRHTAPVIVPVVVPAPEVDGYCNILDLQFEINAEDIQRHDEEKLLILANYLKKHSDTNAVVEGHTDHVGHARDNLRLSQRRADNVMNYMISTHGIARSRLSAVGYGDTRPLVAGRSDHAKRQNRRIGVVIACVKDIQGLEKLPARITMAMQIEFDQNEADVGSQYHADLRDVARFMRDNPSIIATVEGHSDNSSPEMSREISLRRAQNVVNYLARELRVERSRLTAVGFGETRRFAYNTSTEGRQSNRRVNIILKYSDEGEAGFW